jgi:hypothetical protein
MNGQKGLGDGLNNYIGAIELSFFSSDVIYSKFRTTSDIQLYISDILLFKYYPNLECI